MSNVGDEHYFQIHRWLYVEKGNRAPMETADRTREERFLGSQRQDFLMLNIV